MQKTFKVAWEIEVDADNHKDAARKALEIQRNSDSSATVFDVVDVTGMAPTETRRIDLLGD